MNDASAIAAQLARRAPALAAELLPAGKKDGAEWRVGSLAGEPGKSCAVHLFGHKAGLWSDFASGEAGDALDLVAAVRCGGNLGEAMIWARAWLGLGSDGMPPRARAAPPPAPYTEADDRARREAAERIFDCARKVLAHTPVAWYLAARGINLDEFPRPPHALRYHSGLWCSEARTYFPAMVAAITDMHGGFLAAHRTWLQRDARGTWRKAELDAPKKSFGSVAGGMIHLWQGASRKPLGEAAGSETIVIAEGIETALSVAIACPELRIASAVSLGNMVRVLLPPAVATVIVAADDDENPKAQRALEAAVRRWLGEGRQVRIARPPIGKDFNDTLRAERA